MQDYKTIMQVINLRVVQKLPRNICEGKCKLGHGTYQRIEKMFRESGKSYDDLLAMDHDEVVAIFYPEASIRRKKIPLPDYNKIHTSISKHSSTLFIEWMDYKKDNENGYQYTQFCEHYNRFIKENYGDDLSMAVNRMPGEKLFIDWVGDRPKLVFDSNSQALKEAHFFVTSMGVSNMIYVKAYENEKLPNFIDGTKCAIEYLGAVPKYLVPDNLKTAVNKHTKDELIINAAYEDLENHYGTIILPPPSRKPKGKATVERYVQFVEKRIIPKLSKNIYPSFESLNNRLFELIEESNNEYSKKLKAIKKETFEAYDKPAMNPLPQVSFSMVDYKYVSKVPNNYHVEYDGHYYSIPFAYADKSVMIKATFTDVKIVDMNNSLIFKHSRSYKAFPKYITEDSHMPSSHRFYNEINTSNGDELLKRANRIGPNVGKLCKSVMYSFKHEEQSYNSLNGIIHLCDGLSYVMCDEVAKSCLDIGSATYSYFKKALTATVNSKDKNNNDLPKHNNIRGKDFYK